MLNWLRTHSGLTPTTIGENDGKVYCTTYAQPARVALACSWTHSLPVSACSCHSKLFGPKVCCTMPSPLLMRACLWRVSLFVQGFGFGGGAAFLSTS